MIGSERIRGYAARVSGAVNRRPTLPGRLLLWAVVSLAVVLVFIIVLPLLVIVGAVTIAGLAVALARRALTRAQAPNGVLDGRRNVRVIPRSEE